MKVFRNEPNAPLTIEIETAQEQRVVHAILRQVGRHWFKPTNETGQPLSDDFAAELQEVATRLAPVVEQLYPHHTGQHQL